MGTVSWLLLHSATPKETSKASLFGIDRMARVCRRYAKGVGFGKEEMLLGSALGHHDDEGPGKIQGGVDQARRTLKHIRTTVFSPLLLPLSVFHVVGWRVGMVICDTAVDECHTLILP